MNIYNKNYFKIFILFFIFYSGTCNSNNQSYNNTPYKKNLIYYTSKNRCIKRTQRVINPYNVLAKDILRKYIYIINVVVIYIILYSI